MTTSIGNPGSTVHPRPAVVEVTLPERPELPASGTTAPEAAASPERERVAEAARQVEQFFQSVRRNLHFREDEASGRVVVSVVDSETGEVIRQIPPEQVMRMAERLPYLNGVLVGSSA